MFSLDCIIKILNLFGAWLNGRITIHYWEWVLKDSSDDPSLIPSFFIQVYSIRILNDSKDLKAIVLNKDEGELELVCLTLNRFSRELCGHI